MSYISSICKEYGGVEPSVFCLKECLKRDKANSNYTLALIHNYECLCKYRSAMLAGMLFLRENPDTSVGTVTSKQIFEMVASLHPENWSNERPLPFEVYSAISETPKDEPFSSGKAIPPPKTAFDAEEEKEKEKEKKTDYSEIQLNLLAIYFTLVKMLVVLGLFDRARNLVTLLEPLREGQELHKTLIRNEHSYFVCSSMLLSHVSVEKAMSLKSRSEAVFVLGDSHALSSGWQPITIKGQQKIIIPMVVTGLKIWHTRKESKFYPKVNLESAVKQIPKNALVVSLFGEIDCREGMLVAIQKCRFNSIEEVAQNTSDLYLELLTRLNKEKGFELFVHPAAPVLDVTRRLIMTFNASLKQTITAANHPHIFFLDFMEDLLIEHVVSEEEKQKHPLHNSGYILSPEFDLDGTHLHPCYITKVMQPKLEKLVK